AIAPVGRTDENLLQLIRIKVTSPEQAAYLMTHFDESHNHSADEIEIVAWPGDRAQLDALGYAHRVVVEDLVARGRAEAAKPKIHMPLPGPDYTDYRVLGDYNREMTELADKEPKLVKLFEMPRPSLEGRTILGLEITEDVKDVATDGRPIFYIDAVHHAREWPASEFTMMFAHFLAEEYGKNPKVTSLLKKARVILVPVVNVDGFHFSRSSPESLTQPTRDHTWPLGAVNGFAGYWRKNRRSLTGITVPVAQTNPDAYGVDPNRNYAYLWGDQQGGSSNSQINATYRGEAPFSEPEVANVRDIVLSRPVTSVVTNHTVQASVLRAGGGQAPDDADLERIGQEMADLLTFANNPTVGYPTTGTTDDWAYAAIGSYGWTIEHGGSDFHCAYSECVQTPTDRTMEAFLVALETAADNRYHSVIEGRVADGEAKLTLTKKFKTPLSPNNPIDKDFIVEKIKMKLTTQSDGSFEWHVGPSYRPYEKKAESYTLTITQGGQTKTIDVFVRRGQVLNLGTIKL
ncbi:MAG TPA: M14 family zinc carboxypeptidase, partial [Actinomycetota bacterium]|nr:M14 family zinc carboxypeptidase [Actinomycetota bacterium]